ncbi:MAG: YdcF family protein [Lachnospiraceae bacterium]|nr:YdcF family protein [Lachnospiraceae bacterium]
MIAFDTLDKKPTVWNIAAVTAAAAAVTLFLITQPSYTFSSVCAVFILHLVLVLFCLVRALILQIRYNPYSYNTIYYAGFSLFALSVLITQVLVLAQLGGMTGHRVSDVLPLLSHPVNSGTNFMLYTSPFLLFFSGALLISNLSLIRHEGRRLVNILGIILSFLLVGGLAVIYLLNFYASGSQFEVMMHDLLVNLLAAFYLYFECMLLGVIFANILAVRHQPAKDKDYLIVLGCGLRKDGTPTPLLAGRIERALRFYREQIQATGKAPVFVTSGGQGPREVISESASMTAYLLEKGVPKDHILQEDKSTSTFENMKFSREVIRSAEEAAGRRADFKKPSAMQPGDRAPKIAYATTNYHVFRSGLMARRNHMRADGMGARTKWYFWPNAAVREFVGILTEHRLKQGLILGGMIAFYVVTTVLNYTL